MCIKNALILLSFCLVPFLSIIPVEAAPVALLLGGEADTEEQAYIYTGIVGEKRLGDHFSLMGRVWFDYLTYTFERDTETIKAKAPAVQPAVGLKFFGDRWGATVWAGWRHRNKTISTDKLDLPPPDVEKGVSDSLLLQVEIDKWTDMSTNFNLIASYSTEDKGYTWGRGRIKQEFWAGWLPMRVGVEVLAHGNRDYNAFQTGPLLEICAPSQNFAILVHGGYKKSTSISKSAYGGVELFFGF